MSGGGDGFAAVRTGLILRLADLRARGARVAADLTAPISADAEDAAIEREDDDALAGEDALLAREVAAVTAAITRIDEGSYGICTSCGKVVEFKDEVIEERQKTMAESLGFALTDHSLNLYGICAACLKAGGKGAA